MSLILVSVFVIGYLAIVFESGIRLNKTATSLLTGVLCWTVYALASSNHLSVSSSLTHHLSSISEILFFIMGAMTIVEVMSSHNGFDFLIYKLTSTSKRVLLWQLAWLAFFLSAVLDNITATIVMLSLAQKRIPEKKDRWVFASIIVIAVNAGGAWSPIGDVTTTMLWIGGQVSTFSIITKLFLPSIMCLLVPLMIQSYFFSGSCPSSLSNRHQEAEPHSKLIFFLGLSIFFLVPIFKMVTHLPPYIGMLMGVGILWCVADWLHHGKEGRDHLHIKQSLTRIDLPSILFFLGILLAVSSLEAGNVLSRFALWLDHMVPNTVALVSIFGVLSSIVDNVPLVAAAIGMYPLSLYPMDHSLWTLLAFASGTGGSILILGSSAGIVAMGMEGIGFVWYLKRMSLLAISGFLSGIIVYVGLVRFVF